MTALMYASEDGHTDVVKALLALRGININMKNNVKKSVFMD